MSTFYFSRARPSQGARAELVLPLVFLRECRAQLFGKVLEDLLLAALVLVNLDGGDEGDAGPQGISSFPSCWEEGDQKVDFG